jgi:hypothetical protein
LTKCTTCHLTWPNQPGPHNQEFLPANLFLPVVSKR